MMPSLIYEKLINIFPDRVYESQSLKSCPRNDGYFVTVSLEEFSIPNVAIGRGIRTMTIAIHHNAELDKNYIPITHLMNLIDEEILLIDDEFGTDNIRVSQVRRLGRSGNLIDEGWNTITRNATYGVSYNEYAA